MAAGSRDWSKTVFRLRGLPCASLTRDDVCTLLSESLGDTPVGCIEIFSLASGLTTRPPTDRVATLMFKRVPSLVGANSTNNEWGFQSKPPQCYLILDTHFLGMTPLNDPEPSDHVFDCIAISGLSSHPFGSWQPKTDDKTFMWVRDILPGRLPESRAIIYGYDTKLDDSTSFQLISDLAGALITRLDTYGWNKPSANKIVFLAHSLGGLVLKEALISLNSNKKYKILLDKVKGAILFGVPNHGMEQSHFMAVVGNNANRSLVEDLSRRSDYILRHQTLFEESHLSDVVRFFWAYETKKSPTVRELIKGQLSRDGPLAVLVSRDSATCGNLVGSEAFPINATHSDMVKYTRGSEYIDSVIKKIDDIMEDVRGADATILGPKDGDQHIPISTGQQLPDSMSKIFNASIENFRRATSITDSEYAEFSGTDFNKLENHLEKSQQEQERSGNLLNMNRLEPFLTAVKQYIAVTREASLSSELGCYIWGPMKYVLEIASTLTEAYHSVLDAYNDMGDSIPLLSHSNQRLRSKPFLRDIFIVIFDDILEFHLTIISLFKRRCWKQIFIASWKVEKTRLDRITQNMQRNRRSLEYSETFTEFENSQSHRLSAAKFTEKIGKQDKERQKKVLQWLSVYLCDEEHILHRETRKICQDAGRWLLQHKDFKNWLDPESCPFPLLWLTGKPGAGKTILASIVIDEVRSVKDSTVVFFYCKYGDDRRDSLVSILRSLLGQLIPKIPHLLPYFYEKASVSGEGFLSKPSIVKEMLQMALDSLDKTYIIVDGLDECGKQQAKEITSWFQDLMENLCLEDRSSVRCLFVSQDEAKITAPTISVTEHLNKGDLSKVAAVWHRQLENKFGPLRSSTTHIQNILLTRARGMFIFAELMFKYLEDQPNLASLIQELKSERLPVKLTEVYSRIIQRIFDRGPQTAKYIKQVLGWIVCANRPLYWREIQGAICIDVDNQIVDYERQLVESPRGLFAALVEVDPNGIVQLVHDTARVYLKEEHVLPNDTNLSLSLLTLNYLAFPQFDLALDDDTLIESIRNGGYAFYDYASVFWAAHLQSSMPLSESKDQVDEFQTTLNSFLGVHWSSPSNPPKVGQRLEHSLDSIQAPELREKVSQAILSHRKQVGTYRKPPASGEVLNIWRVTERSRALFEKIAIQELSEPEGCGLSRFYGSNWFRCPRMDCFFYYHGFQTQEERESHVLKHERPFFCSVAGCLMNFAGCISEDELNAHLFGWHGVDRSDETEYPKAPKQTKQTRTESTRDPNKPFCEQCLQSFAGKSSLKRHIRAKHERETPFACDICGQRFGRKYTLDRHRPIHDEEDHRDKFICEGELEDGSKWGCGRAFLRKTVLSEHFTKRTGRNCIRPYLLQLEKQKLNSELTDGSNRNIFANQSGINAKTLLAIGESLPSFDEFLRICGLGQLSTNDANGDGLISESEPLS